MDVLAQRKTGGSVRGRVLLNGHEASDLTIRRATGYCEQQDIHTDSATIREVLTFSALLRQDADVPLSAKLASVSECLDLLNLLPIADQVVRQSAAASAWWGDRLLRRSWCRSRVAGDVLGDAAWRGDDGGWRKPSDVDA